MYHFYSYSMWKNLKFFFHVSLVLESNARKIMHLSLSLNQLVNLLTIVNLRGRGIFGGFEKSLWYCSFNRSIVQSYRSILHVVDKFNPREWDNVHEWFIQYRGQFASVNGHNSTSFPVTCGVFTSNIHSRTSLVLVTHKWFSQNVQGFHQCWWCFILFLK